MKTNLQQLTELLSARKKIIITTHKNPDGDAIGSSLGLYNYLTGLKHQVTVIVPDNYPDYLKWMPGAGKIVVFEKSEKKAADKVKEAELIFCLDFNSLKRIEELGKLVEKSKAPKVLIDHHPEPAKFYDISFSDAEASSTAQLVFELIENLQHKKRLNKPVANCLYAGMLTDTGSFRFSSTSAQTHRIIADLIDAGAENVKVYEWIYDNNTEDRVKLLGYCLSQKLKVFEEFSAALITLTYEEMAQFNYKKGDTEGVVNYALSIAGIKMAAFFRETEEGVRMSFRSKDNFSVNNFARKHFNGGGHFHAAGGSWEESLDDAILKFVSLLPEYRDELNNA